MTAVLQTAKRAVENFEEKIGVLLVDAHRRREPDRLSPESAFAKEQTHFLAGFHDLRALVPGRLFPLSIFHQLDPEQEAFSAHVAGDVVFFFPFVEPCENSISNFERVCLKFFAFDHLEDGAGLRTDNRISAEGVEMNAL